MRYETNAPTRDAIDTMPGSVVLQFGTDWCGYCQAAEPLVTAALADFPNVARLLIEDGKGRPLGRSFGVQRWPTLVFLVDGREVARVTRPADSAVVRRAAATMTESAQSDG